MEPAFAINAIVVCSKPITLREVRRRRIISRAAKFLLALHTKADPRHQQVSRHLRASSPLAKRPKALAGPSYVAPTVFRGK